KVCRGRRVRAQRQADGEHLAGRVPLAEPAQGRLRGHLSGAHLPAQRLWPHDMIGNVWEWTTDWYALTYAQQKSCCMPVNPRGPREEESYDPCQPRIKIPRKVIKGGSHLCAPSYCRRYRP